MFKKKFFTAIIFSIAFIGNACAQQNLIGNILGGLIQQQNIASWNKVPKQEKQCLNDALRKDGYDLNQLILKGIPPESSNLSVLRRNCKNQLQAKKQEILNNQENNVEFFPDGRYLKTQADCDKLISDPEAEFDSILRIKNNGNEISGWEFGCQITSKTKNQNSYNIKATCMGEGEKWKKNTTFKYDSTKFNFGYFSNNESYELCDKPSNKNEVNNQIPKDNTILKKSLTVGNRCGAHATINEMTNINGDNAKIIASMTKDQAEEICTCDFPTPEEAIKGKELEACIIDEMKIIYEANADCSKGMINDTYKMTRIFNGKISDGNYQLLDTETKKSLDVASYTNYFVTINQFSLLCPKLTCANKVAGEYLDGCK